jgi:hypothetical protein
VDFKTTYIYKSKDPAGDWSKVGEIGTCYYDCGMLFDGQNIYVAVSVPQFPCLTLTIDAYSAISSMAIPKSALHS